MSVDYKWMSSGGLLMDGLGDIAFTESSMEVVVSMVRSRLKAAVDGWKLYRIGAGLDDFPGNTSDAAIESAIQRRVLSSLSNKYLPANVFDVQTLRLGGVIQIYVYLNALLIAQAEVATNSTSNAVV